jgi:hypothetical protein
VNWYELWFKANTGAQWVKYTDTPAQRPRFRIGTSVHLLDWRQARYFVKACNPSGCSQSNEVGVNGEQFAAIGYFKPATPAPDQYFGFNFAVSADGTAMAVLSAVRIDRVCGGPPSSIGRPPRPPDGASRPASSRTRTAGGGASVPAIPSRSQAVKRRLRQLDENSTSGAACLFRREPDGWHQTQRIAGDNSASDQFGINVSSTRPAKHWSSAQPARRRASRRHARVYQDLDDGSDQFVHATTCRRRRSTILNEIGAARSR